MRLISPDDDAQHVRAGHHRAGPVADSSNRTGAPHVKTEHGIRLWIVESAFFDHEGRAAFLSAGRSLFGGLEDELHRAGQLILHAGEQLRDAHENGDVIVVTARVHHADFLPVVGRLHLRRKRQVDLFGNGQAVHVGAKRNDLSRHTSTQHADDAGVRDAGADLDAEAAKMIGHEPGRADFTIPKLGILVNITAPSHDVVCDLLCAAVDFCRERALCSYAGTAQHDQHDGNQWMLHFSTLSGYCRRPIDDEGDGRRGHILNRSIHHKPSIRRHVER
jgi:hypothetical protein